MIGGVIEGEVVAAGTGGPFLLVLIDRSTAGRTTFETFSDGSFYRMGVPPGRYALTVEGAAGSVVTADTVRFSLESGPGWPLAGVEVRSEDLIREAAGTTVSGLRLQVRSATLRGR